MTKGWCPVHDRVFETADGLCPECGTALVDVEPRRPEDGRVVVPEAEDEPASTVKTSAPEPTSGDSFPIGPATLATVVTAVVVVAFLAGLAFPRGRGARSSTTTTTPQTLADYTLGAERQGAGLALRLESFSQRGRQIVLRISLDLEAPVSSGHIDIVTVSARSGGREWGPVELEARPTTSGFIVQGTALELPDLAVTEVTIDSFKMATPKSLRLEVPVDLARVWTDNDRSRLTTITPDERRFGDGRMLRRLTFVGWRDMLEARIEIQGERAGWYYDDAYSLRTDLGVYNAFENSPPTAGVRHVFFVASRGTDRRARVSIVPRTVTVAGGWRWTLPSAG